ncbi:hypothetical protein [Brevundimonas sp.]|uniref:hypothetical protein n=1 Tax=Brevundimonas TaxID=41275 RepID=UPI0028976EDA|nr:hypothetical protein [Brevundimonas sp.]
MFEWSNRSLMTAALFALVIVVFGFLPAVDAAACAPEARAAVAASSLSSPPDQDHGKAKDGDQNHSGCAHGHCHHGSTGMQQASIPVPASLKKADGPKAPTTNQMASRTPAGPDRPPRS